MQANIHQQQLNPSASRSISFNFWNRQNRKVYFGAEPGFGQNYGRLGNRDYTSHRSGHTEPNLISMEYTQNHTEGDWNVANAAVRNTNQRSSFTLYTERSPCQNCTDNLNLDIYTQNDDVSWSVQCGNINNIVLQPNYINQANQWLNSKYQYMNPNRNWSVGYIGVTPKLVCSY